MRICLPISRKILALLLCKDFLNTSRDEECGTFITPYFKLSAALRWQSMIGKVYTMAELLIWGYVTYKEGQSTGSIFSIE